MISILSEAPYRVRPATLLFPLIFSFHVLATKLLIISEPWSDHLFMNEDLLTVPLCKPFIVSLTLIAVSVQQPALCDLLPHHDTRLYSLFKGQSTWVYGFICGRPRSVRLSSSRSAKEQSGWNSPPPHCNHCLCCCRLNLWNPSLLCYIWCWKCHKNGQGNNQDYIQARSGVNRIKFQVKTKRRCCDEFGKKRHA